MSNTHCDELLIALTPDTYAPNINETGEYVDYVPSCNKINSITGYSGILCPCSNKVYDNRAKFCAHIKSKIHMKWLSHLNNNRANHYVEANRLKELVSQQRKIIARLERDVQNSATTINYLTQQLTNRGEEYEEINLLDV